VTAHTHFETLVLGRPAVTPLLAVCPVPGLQPPYHGGTCVQHDEPVDVDFPRGRPFVPGPAAVTSGTRHSV
jgi:hypothetical protein